jgi:hypothetical protein
MGHPPLLAALKYARMQPGPDSPEDLAPIREIAKRYTLALRTQDWKSVAQLSTGPLESLITDMNARGMFTSMLSQWHVGSVPQDGADGIDLSSRVVAVPWRAIDKITLEGDTATVEYAGQAERLTLDRTANGWRVSQVGSPPGSSAMPVDPNRPFANVRALAAAIRAASRRRSD